MHRKEWGWQFNLPKIERSATALKLLKVLWSDQMLITCETILKKHLCL